MRALARLVCLTLALALGLGAGGGVLTAPAARAQPSAAVEAIDYAEWEKLASRAEEAVDAARASTAAFEALRSELVVWRERFLAAQDANQRSIATIKRQLEALGPPPEDGVEAPEIAAEREALNKRLAELQTPVKRAEINYNRADGLIKAIDAIIRDRQARALLELGPSPLNPAHWPTALSELAKVITQIHAEVVAAWKNPTQQAETRGRLPVIVVLALIGLLLVLRGRDWSRRASGRVLGEDPGAGRWLVGFVLSLGSLALPLLGVKILVEAAYGSGLAGFLGDEVLATLVPAAAIFLTARWLATRVFPAVEARAMPLSLDESQRRAGRRNGAFLGLTAALYQIVLNVADAARWTEETTNTVLFPLIVLCACFLFGLAGLLRRHAMNTVAEADGDEAFRTRLERLLAGALFAVSLASPLLAAVGYFKLAQYLLFPTLASLAILAVLLVLQRLVVELYVLITGSREKAAQSLVPVMIGFLLVLLSLPFFALAWGARPADLQELWLKVVQGIDIGGVRISPTAFLTFVLVFSLGFVATRLFQGALRNTVLPKTRIDPGGQKAIVSGVGYVGIFVAALLAISSAGIDLSSIAIVAGALSVGIGFGLQTIVSNFVSGIILLIERPISEGDWIEVGGVHGTVKKISVRSTIIETFDRSDVIVPNADLISGRVTNYTLGNTIGRVIVPVGVAYGTDTHKVEKILREIAEAHPMVLLSTPPAVIFQGFGSDSLNFEIRAILRDVNTILSVRSDMNHEINRRFAEEGIEIPFPQRDIWLRNPETLRPAEPVQPRAPRSADDPESSRAHLTTEDLAASHGSGPADRDGDDGR